MVKIKSLVVAIAGLLFLVPVAPASANAECYTPGPFTNLSHCNFVGVDLSGLDLSYSDLTGANLTDTNLADTDLTGVHAEKVVGIPSALPQGWVVNSRFLIGPDANLSYFDLSNLDLRNLNLQGADLTAAILTKVKLNNTDLTDATLTSIAGSAITGTPKVLPEDWTIQKGFLVGPTANLSSQTLTDIDFTQLNISGASLSMSTLVRANFSGMDLVDVTLDAATLTDTNVSDTLLGEVNLDGLKTSGLIGTPGSLPAGWELHNGFLFGPGANLSGTDFSNTDFTGINLLGVSLQDANLTNSDLTGVDLTDTVIAGATLKHTNITDTDLTGVDLTGITSSGLIGTPIGLDENWQLYVGFLIGPGANLSDLDWTGLDLRGFALAGTSFVGANLSGTNLAEMDLTGINLTGANLTGANLTDTFLADATLDQILARDIIGTPLEVPAPFIFKKGFIIGPTANLAAANLTGFDLRDQDLSDATFTTAKLNNADLRGAILTGAAMGGTDLTGAKLLRVISGNVTGKPSSLPKDFTFSKGTFKVILVLTPIPKVSGTAIVGSKLTVTPGAWDEAVTLSYQWSRNSEAIAGADKKAFTTGVIDFNKKITVTVTGVGTGGTTKSMTSVVQTIAAAPMITRDIKVTGSFIKGKTLTVTATPWIAGAQITYSWLLDGKPIKKANKNTYKILPKQAGKKLSVMVIQTAEGYTTTSVTSKATKVK